MRAPENTVEILILSLSKDGDFGPSAYFAEVPFWGRGTTRKVVEGADPR